VGAQLAATVVGARAAEEVIMQSGEFGFNYNRQNTAFFWNMKCSYNVSKGSSTRLTAA
jgi:hypothetical protein